MQTDLEQRTAKRRAKRLKRKVRSSMSRSCCNFSVCWSVCRLSCSSEALGLMCTVTALDWLRMPICLH